MLATTADIRANVPCTHIQGTFQVELRWRPVALVQVLSCPVSVRVVTVSVSHVRHLEEAYAHNDALLKDMREDFNAVVLCSIALN